MKHVSQLLRRAESILRVATAPNAKAEGTAIVLDRAGLVRVVNPDGWTLSALIQEFGGVEVYIVSKFAGTVTVEAWSVLDRCTVREKDSRANAGSDGSVWATATQPDCRLLPSLCVD